MVVTQARTVHISSANRITRNYEKRKNYTLQAAT